MRTSTGTLFIVAALCAACHNGSGGGAAPASSSFGAEVRLDTDLPGAGDSDGPQLIVDGARIYAVWRDDRQGVEALFFNRSTDGGVTWLDDDVFVAGSEGAGMGDNPTQFCSDGDRLYLSWGHDPLGDGKDDIFVSASTNGGLTWFADPAQIDGNGPGSSDGDDPAIGCSGATVVVVWKDDRFGGGDEILYNRSTDGGVTWDGEELLRDVPPGFTDSRRHRIEVDGDTVAICWMDARDGEYDIFLSCSTDGAETWAVSNVRVEADTPGAADSAEPQLVLEGSEILVVWEDHRDDGPTGDVYVQRSVDFGATWLAEDVRLDDAPPGEKTHEIEMRRDGPNVIVIWELERFSSEIGFMNSIYANASADGGATWLPQEVRVDDKPTPTSDADDADVCISGTNVLVVFEDNRDGKDDIRGAFSTDGGATFGESVRAETDAPGATQSDDPEVACSAEAVFLLWEDDRNGEGDIYGVPATFDQ